MEAGVETGVGSDLGVLDDEEQLVADPEASQPYIDVYVHQLVVEVPEVQGREEGRGQGNRVEREGQ